MAALGDGSTQDGLDELSYWRKQCDLDGNCDFADCEPPEQRYWYYGNTTLVTWETGSHEDILVKRLEDISYERFLLDGTIEDSKCCDCIDCNVSRDTAVSTAIAKLVKKTVFLENEIHELLKARVEAPGKCLYHLEMGYANQK